MIGQWIEHIEILGLFFLIVGVSLSVIRCISHYASLSERRKVLPYIGSVVSSIKAQPLFNRDSLIL